VVESHSKRAGGGPIYWASLSKWLIRRGHKVIILSGIEKESSFASPNTIGLIPVKSNLRQRSISTLVSRLKFTIRLIPFVRSYAKYWQPDIIHTVPPIASEAGLRAGKAVKVPVVASILSHVEEQWSKLESLPVRAALFRQLERRAIRQDFSRIICLTQRSRRVLLAEGIGSDRLVHIPHAVDTEKFTKDVHPYFREKIQLSPDSFVLGYAGALTRDKGIDHLINAIARLQHHSKLHLLLAGEGAHRQYFEHLVKTKKMKNVTFLGRIEHESVPAFMASLDLYVVPSYTETLPTSVLEALATGTPVMATGVGGTAEFLDNKLGVVLDRPDVKIIAEAIDKWMDRRKELKRMGERGYQQIMKEHTWEKTSFLTERVYEQCLQKK
jgi:glycogen(starch) synthase